MGEYIEPIDQSITIGSACESLIVTTWRPCLKRLPGECAATT
jgi:hypothetical protein